MIESLVKKWVMDNKLERNQLKFLKVKMKSLKLQELNLVIRKKIEILISKTPKLSSLSLVIKILMEQAEIDHRVNQKKEKNPQLFINHLEESSMKLNLKNM